ncbi:MAG: hypothetical protein E7Z74_06665 [Methanobrevibacter millerae]|uniref:Uncharacterized protein n=1 Tax=Methanobrevibacter millerae TaxID=230361 RepID=A0A8T3VID7_9EURY|nr:hypothetical protein [Methanobrevibacter millerae]
MGNSKIVNLLFYWRENNRYLFSRTKFLTLAVFAVSFIFTLNDLSFFFSIIYSLSVSLIVFIAGFAVHKIVDIDAGFYEGNLGDDIRHFLLFWNDGYRKFRLSKTKLLTVSLVIIGLIRGIASYFAGEGSLIALGNILVLVVFAIIAFVIGAVIHQLTGHDHSRYAQKDVDVSKSTKLPKTNENTSPIFVDYLKSADELKREFDESESKARDLINAKFEPPQITNDKFMAVVDNSRRIFDEQYSGLLNLINYSKSDSAKIEGEITSRMDNLKSITDKLNDLSDELVISMSKSKDGDIHNVLNDVETLIDSINDYDE